MRDFRQLKVWEKSHSLTLKVYRLTQRLPREELFSLTSQSSRASSSIPMNIAEGRGRGSDKEYAYFLQMAVGSASELDYQILLAKDLDYVDNANYTELNGEISSLRKQLASLLQKVRAAT